ncbi:MAG: Eco29kI family restriction endonuclease [Anaerolineae bacterium]|nr:Eco29kI family restriction endonuclease [Anaerolineae bacterium]
MTESFDCSKHIFSSPRFRSVVNEAVSFFIQTPLQILPPPEPFIGCGVYALYYLGEYDLYSPLSQRNQKDCQYPIYVGKAVAPGWRTGRVNVSTTPDLHNRLREHSRSLQQAHNLQHTDFQCRFMILNDIEGDLVVPVEASLIRRYQPLWNMLIDGFGNHDPGSGRYNQAKSEWDVLHPGRVWAEKLSGAAPDLGDIIAKLKSHWVSSDFA